MKPKTRSAGILPASSAGILARSSSWRQGCRRNWHAGNACATTRFMEKEPLLWAGSVRAFCANFPGLHQWEVLNPMAPSHIQTCSRNVKC